MSEEKKPTRAFICIEFSDEAIKEIARVQEMLSKVKFTGKLTEPENLHLTLKFLGEIDEDKLEKARKEIKKIDFSTMNLKLGKIGTFSIRGNPRIVWIKVEGKVLYELQKRIDDCLKGLFASEERFMGHLTIARIKYAKDKKGFLSHIESIHVKPVAFSVSKFSLKKSELKPIGPTYTDIEVIESKK